MLRIAASVGLCCILSVAVSWAAQEKKPEPTKFKTIDLQAKGNKKLADEMHGRTDGNYLTGLKAGEQTLEGVTFKLGEKYIQLVGTVVPDEPEKVEGIAVKQKFEKLHILHATGWAADDDTIIGEYTVNWEDGTSVTIPIRYGKDVLNWWYSEEEPEPSQGKVAWKGENEAAKLAGKKIRLYMTTWENPKPDKKVFTIDYSSTKQGQCAPFCLAITAEGK